jgi:hypothetical protein
LDAASEPGSAAVAAKGNIYFLTAGEPNMGLARLLGVTPRLLNSL